MKQLYYMIQVSPWKFAEIKTKGSGIPKYWTMFRGNVYVWPRRRVPGRLIREGRRPDITQGPNFARLLFECEAE